MHVYSERNIGCMEWNILHRNKSFFTILDSRYYGVKNVEAGEEAVEHPTITVTEYEGDKVQAKIVPPLHRSRTDSIISYSNPGNNQANIERFYDYHQV